MKSIIGKNIYNFSKKIWSYNRSLTGKGVLNTLNDIKKIIPSLKIKNVKSGKKAFDWNVPNEWEIKDAYIINPEGNKICSLKKNNLHLVGYSYPINKKMKFSELNKKLYSLPKMPNAIPYNTSYYNKDWGFCISHNERKKLSKKGLYKVYINSKIKKGFLHYGELLIKGKSKKEVFISTYICHPSMANNEISGPAVLTYIAKWISGLKNRRYSYRIIFIPETIGSIVYLSKNLKQMKKNILFGYNLTCVGDERNYSIIPSKYSNTITDKISLHVIKNIYSKYKVYNWKDRASDERQYCSPGIDLPVVTLCRTKPGNYKEYHTSLDKLGTVVTSKGLEGGFELVKKCLEAIEFNFHPITKIKGEPFLSKRKLAGAINEEYEHSIYKKITDMLTYCDGKNDLIDIAEKLDIPVWKLYDICLILKKNKLINSQI